MNLQPFRDLVVGIARQPQVKNGRFSVFGKTGEVLVSFRHFGNVAVLTKTRDRRGVSGNSADFPFYQKSVQMVAVFVADIGHGINPPRALPSSWLICAAKKRHSRWQPVPGVRHYAETMINSMDYADS
jgi:hypothetical protein